MLPPKLSDFLISPEHETWATAALESLARGEFPKAAQEQAASASGFWPEDPTSFLAMVRPYKIVDGVLHVPVLGVLMHRFPYQWGSMATGYEYVREAIKRGVEDPQVKGIALVIDSPGGTVSGAFDTGDMVYEARGQKPVHAFVSEHAYSAGYAIASAAENISVARTGGVGSIGVLATHVDLTEAAARQGVKFTFIHAGEYKTEGHPMAGQLDDEARKRWQDRVNRTYDIFVASVARNRGIEEEDVRATEALVFSAQEAVSNGLADQIGPFDDAVAAFAAQLTDGGDSMSKDTNQGVDQATHEAAVETAKTEGFAAGKAEGLTEGAVAERTRIQTILGSEEAKARPSAAEHVAMNTNMAADEAASFLAAIPVEAKTDPASQAQGGNAFEEAMNRENPNLDANAGGKSGSGDDLATIMGDYKSLC